MTIKKKTIKRQETANAALRVLQWIEQLIRTQKLGLGDALPSELEIASATGSGRSSVREALTALKVLGIIHTRRKGGITIIRDPVLLELRHYFVENYQSPELRADVMEFRAAMEWGLGPLLQDRMDRTEIPKLKSLIHEAADRAQTELALAEAEIQFHSALTSACGNHLASLFAHLYPPIFRSDSDETPDSQAFQDEREIWRREHLALIDALEQRDSARFTELLRQHTHQYMRWRKHS